MVFKATSDIFRRVKRESAQAFLIILNIESLYVILRVSTIQNFTSFLSVPTCFTNSASHLTLFNLPVSIYFMLSAFVS